MLQAILAEPIHGQTGGSILYVPTGAVYPARVSPFQMQQILVAGGLSPMRLGTVIVSKSDLPDGITGDPDTAFAVGTFITATMPGGQRHVCEVYSVDDEITEFKLTLWDKNQRA